MNNNKPFDLKDLDATFNSRSDAYQMLEIESIKRCKANVIRQWAEVKNQRHINKTTVVCVTDSKVKSLEDCICSYRAVIKRSRKRDNVKYYIEKEGRNLEHNPNTCIKDSASCKANTTVGSKYLKHVSTMHPLPINVTGYIYKLEY